MLSIIFHTDNPEIRARISRHWAVKHNGKWNETIESIAKSEKISFNDLRTEAKVFSTAYDTNISCECGELKEIPNRSAYKPGKIGTRINYMCPKCIKNAKDITNNEKFKDLLYASRLKEEFLKNESAKKYNFPEISCIDAIYTHVLFGEFKTDSFKEINIATTRKIFNLYENPSTIEMLYEKGILRLKKLTDMTPLTVSDTGTTHFDTSNAFYELSCDQVGRSSFDIKEIILKKALSADAETIYSIFEEVSIDECFSYFSEQWTKMNFEAENNFLEVYFPIQYALNFYSVPEVFQHINEAVDQIALDVLKGHYEKDDALINFSSVLIRKVNYAKTSSWSMDIYNKSNSFPKSPLAEFLFNVLLGGRYRDWFETNYSNIRDKAEQVVANRSF